MLANSEQWNVVTPNIIEHDKLTSTVIKWKRKKNVGNVVSKNDLISQQKQKLIKKIYSNAFTTWKQKPRMNNNNKMK